MRPPHPSSEVRSSPIATLRRLRDAAATMRRLSDLEPEADAPVLPEMRRLLDRLTAARTLEALPLPCNEDGRRLFSYRAKPETGAPSLRFRVIAADGGLLRFLGVPAPGFEVLQVQQAGLQSHWQSDLVRAFEEQFSLLGAFCAFAPQGELLVEHLAVPVIRRHRVREIQGWIALGRNLSGELFGPDSLSTTRRLLRSRHVRLPPRLLHSKEPSAPLRVRSRLFSRGGGAPADP